MGVVGGMKLDGRSGVALESEGGLVGQIRTGMMDAGQALGWNRMAAEVGSV